MNLIEKIGEAIRDDGFLLIGITGERGRGKSVLGLNLLYEVLKDWDKVLKHTIFTIEDFQNLRHRRDLERARDGRVKIALWDDFALHTSSYGFMKGEGVKIADFIEEFEVVREYLAVLVITCATWEMVPPKIRSAPKILINMYSKGKGLILEKEEDSPASFLKRVFRLGGKVKSQKIPDEVYQRYRMLKREAIEVKKAIMDLKREDDAARIAQSLREEDWDNHRYLKALGILDLHGNYTFFGEMVRRKWEEIQAAKHELSRAVFRDVFRKLVSQREFERMAMAYNVKRDTARMMYKSLLDTLVVKEESKNGQIKEIIERVI